MRVGVICVHPLHMCTRVMSTEACPRPRRFGISTCRPAPGSDLQGLHVLNKRASHTHMPAILPGSWHGFEEKIGIFLVHVNVCVRVCVGCVVVFCREITSHCSCAEPTRDSTYSHTDTYPAWNTHTHTQHCSPLEAD